jgi:hypothetical protein
MGDVRFEVKQLIDEGWAVVPLLPGTKKPGMDGKDEPKWTTRTYSLEHFSADANVGVKLGQPSGDLIDFDLDCPEAIIAGQFLLPPTGRSHGRPGTGTAHYFYISPGTESKFWLDTDGKKMLEIRSTGGQTMLPPSIHTTGEQLKWANRDKPDQMERVVAEKTGRNLATATMIGRHWGGKGSRHDSALHLGGFLAARDVDLGTIQNIQRAICAIAKDDEVDDRLKANSTSVHEFLDGGKTTGGPSLGECIGKDVVERLVQWWGGNTAVYDKVVAEMNERRFGARVGKDYVYGLEEEEMVVLQPARALFEEFAHQKVAVGTKTRGENKGEQVFKTKFELWREHPNKRTYRKITFAPPPAKCPEVDYNLWKGYAVEPLLPPPGHAALTSEETLKAWVMAECPPKCQLFLDLVKDIICAGNQEYYDYLLNLMAVTVQQPGTPSEVAVVMKGTQGAGKGTFVRIFGRGLFGRHFIQLDRTEQLAGKFNAALSGKVVVFADEAFFAGDKASLGSLKRLITEPTLAIERKGIDVIEEPNFMHLFMATNEDWAHQAGLKERRFFTLRVSDAHLQDYAYFEAVNRQMMKDPRTGSEGCQALLSLLWAMPADREMVRRVPRTEELRNQQEMSLSTEMRWWHEKLLYGNLGDDAGWPEFTYEQELHDDYLRWCESMKINRRIGTDQLRKVITPWMGTAADRKRREGKWVRSLLPLAEARVLFDALVGSQGEWQSDEEKGSNGPDGPPKDLPF